MTQTQANGNLKRVIALWDQYGSLTNNEKEVGQFLKWLLEESDFFKAPCSTEFHLAVEGGLAEHSLNVYDLLYDKVTRHFGLLNVIPEPSIILCGLGHDLCKVNFYIPGYRNVKDDVTGKWERVSVYKVKDQHPMGHGEKSVSILQDFFKLTEWEKMAIRWHMGGWTSGVTTDYPAQKSFEAALEKSLLVALLISSDYEASHIVEAGK
jgi:hypothetical protein